jgi:hypothetical protein
MILRAGKKGMDALLLETMREVIYTPYRPCALREAHFLLCYCRDFEVMWKVRELRPVVACIGANAGELFLS